MNAYRMPDVSPEARAFFRSILGDVPTTIDPSKLSREQIEQLVIVLEEDAAYLGTSNDPAATVRRGEIIDFTAALRSAG